MNTSSLGPWIANIMRPRAGQRACGEFRYAAFWFGVVAVIWYLMPPDTGAGIISVPLLWVCAICGVSSTLRGAGIALFASSPRTGVILHGLGVLLLPPMAVPAIVVFVAVYVIGGRF